MHTQTKLHDLRTPQEFAEHAKNRGAEVDANGFWIFIRTRRGVTVFPRRDGELPGSLRRHLVEIFLALGLAAFVLIGVIMIGTALGRL